jgi:hypothetical protein
LWKNKNQKSDLDNSAQLAAELLSQPRVAVDDDSVEAVLYKEQRPTKKLHEQFHGNLIPLRSGERREPQKDQVRIRETMGGGQALSCSGRRHGLHLCGDIVYTLAELEKAFNRLFHALANHGPFNDETGSSRIRAPRGR